MNMMIAIPPSQPASDGGSADRTEKCESQSTNSRRPVSPSAPWRMTGAHLRLRV